MESITPNPLTEEWIRQKLNITTDNLEDIKSLSLPGTYQEKIIHLGDSLYKFSRIKELDLSRNSLISLEGIENLKYLEKLNLYFNSINSLKEIDRLANNRCLVQIDLRLNPIAKQDADYRLYLINILPSLQVCDDREIKDGEKQMALTYYNHKNLSKFERKPEYELYSKNENNPLIQLSSRVKSISNIVKRSAGIQEPSSNDDEGIVQNFLTQHVNEREEKIDLNRYSKYNQNSKPSFQQYSPQSLKELGERENREHQRRNSSASDSTKKRSSSLQEMTKEDLNLQFVDETQAGLAFKTRATFTPNPNYEEEIVAATTTDDNQKTKSNNKKDHEEVDEEIQNILSDKNNPIFNLLDLVDRYWNGTKSLHKNYKFLGLANQLLAQYTKYSTQTNPFEVQNNLLQSQLKSCQEENRKLQKDLKNKANDRFEYEAYKKSSQIEIDGLKKRIIVNQEENKRLKKEISERSEKTNNNFSIDSMESENGVLKKDVEVMKLKLKQYEQLQQLTAMLQESHKSLVTTNEHLLREISDSKSTSSHNNNNNNYENRNSFDIDDTDFFDLDNKISSNQKTSTLNSKLANRLSYSTTTTTAK